MTKKFEPIKTIKCAASSPHPAGTQYVIYYGKESFSIDKNSKEVDKVDAIKVVISENGVIIPNKSAVFPIGTNDFYRVTTELNKLACDIMDNLIKPIKLIIQRNINGGISFEELRFEGSLIYDKTFYIKSIFDENGNFIEYDSSNPFLKTLPPPSSPLNTIYYRYKIYKTPKNNMVVYKEHCHIDKYGVVCFFDSDYSRCSEISEVLYFTYNLLQSDVLYLYYLRNEIEKKELKDI